MNIRNEFPDTHRNLPARWFSTVGAAQEFIDYLLREDISFRTDISKRKRKEPFRIAVMYVGPHVVDEEAIHVIPVGDLRGHYPRPTCWCRPGHDEGVWVHNSADGREVHERGMELH